VLIVVCLVVNKEEKDNPRLRDQHQVNTVASESFEHSL